MKKSSTNKKTKPEDASAGATSVRTVLPSNNRLFTLHRTFGNQAVGRLIRQSGVGKQQSIVESRGSGVSSQESGGKSQKSGGIQTKLSIGKPSDIYEQEAERVAGPPPIVHFQHQPVVNRQIAATGPSLAATPATASTGLPQTVVQQWQAQVSAGNLLPALQVVAQEMQRRGEIDNSIFQVQQTTAGAAECMRPNPELFSLTTGVHGANTLSCPCVQVRSVRLANPRVLIHPDLVHLMSIGASGSQPAAEILHATLLHEFRHIRQQYAECNTPGVVTSSGVCTACNDPGEMDASLAEIEAGYNRWAIMDAWIRVYVSWSYLAPAQQTVFLSRKQAAEQKVQQLFPGVPWNINQKVSDYRTFCQSLNGGSVGTCNFFLAPLSSGPTGTTGTTGTSGASGPSLSSAAPLSLAPTPPSEPRIDWLEMNRPYLTRGAMLQRPGDFDAIRQQWMETYEMMRGFGFTEERATQISNTLTPIAIGSGLSRDYPTLWETMGREMGTSSTLINLPGIHF